VECLTKQTHDLEEQLGQKNAALNTQEEDQEGTSTPSRQEQQDTSHPSGIDITPPHIVVEMQMMKE